MELKRVVVTGLGAITPLGNDIPTYWKGLINGVSGAAPITKFDATNFKTQFACEVKGWDVSEFLDRKESRKMDLFAQYAVVCSDQALEDAGLAGEGSPVNPDRAGVIWGSGIGGFQTFMNEALNFHRNEGIPRFSPFFIPMMISDIAAGHISMRHGYRGPNFCTVSACASGTNAMIDAFNYIRLGKADIMVTGGSEAAVTEGGIGGFNALKALSTRNDEPAKASRPFDSTRDGFVLGEGGGAIILEEYEHAVARGAKIYCEMVGGGMSADAHHITAPHPEGLGALNVMKSALDDAGMRPEDVDYVNVHGTSTPLGDVAETKAIQGVFGDHAYDLNISSTKSMTGHLLGAAGGVEAVYSILALDRGVLPPTINLEDPDPECDLDYVAGQARRTPSKIALSNSFGFGGTNACLVFRRVDRDGATAS